MTNKELFLERLGYKGYCQYPKVYGNMTRFITRSGYELSLILSRRKTYSIRVTDPRGYYVPTLSISGDLTDDDYWNLI